MIVACQCADIPCSTSAIDKEFVERHSLAMKAKRRKIKLRIEGPILKRPRREAARQGTSLSGLLEGFLKERMVADRQYEAAMRRALARKPFLSTNTR
jgi:hypothetical protein